MTNSTYQVRGLTCGHCVNAVTSELKALDGVSEVAVELDPAGASTVSVTSTQRLSAAAVRAALDEAGDYRLIESSIESSTESSTES
jgi:copper chaperone